MKECTHDEITKILGFPKDHYICDDCGKHLGNKKPPTFVAPVDRLVILPCPFCGHGARCSVWDSKGYEATGIHFFYCENKKCGARVFQPKNDFDSALKAWNKRAI